MPLQPPIPPILSQYLSTPSDGSLVLLTGTLGATTNWLVLRFVAASLKRERIIRAKDGLDVQSKDAGDVKVILVSWLRDAKFWKDGGRKLGFDEQKISIIDTLNSRLGSGTAEVAGVEELILQAIRNVNGKSQEDDKVLLILDGLDFLLAATAYPVEDLLDMIDKLRGHAMSTVITGNTDSPLLQTYASSNPLEKAHAAFVMSLAHQAKIVMSVRELDTGGATDVSGVLRITNGGDKQWEEGHRPKVVEEKECLYFVGGDGSVRVFERGAWTAQA